MYIVRKGNITFLSNHQNLLSKHLRLLVNFKCILFCTTTSYFVPFFSSLLEKREEEKENKVAKLVLCATKRIIFVSFFLSLQSAQKGWGHNCTLIILCTQLNSCAFWCQHLYGILFASIVCSGQKMYFLGAIWDKFALYLVQI